MPDKSLEMGIDLEQEQLIAFRRREAAVERLAEQMDMPALWSAMLLFQSYPFYTARKLMFTYRIQGGEMFVSRKDKSITRATVELAFQRAMELERVVTGPKKLGVFGASYLYSVFIRLGVIRTTE